MVCLPDLVEVIPSSTVNLLVLGGVGYTSGVPFFVRNNNLDHSIWVRSVHLLFISVVVLIQISSNAHHPDPTDSLHSDHTTTHQTNATQHCFVLAGSIFHWCGVFIISGLSALT